MNRRLLVNLLLVIAIAALGALLWLDPGKQAPVVTPLTTLDTTPIEAVTIRRGERAAIVLQRDHDTWHMQAPFPVSANPQRVHDLLGLLSLPVHNRFPAEGRDLQQYGLDRPELEIDYGNDTVLRVGGTEPLGQQRYVMLGGNINLVENTQFSQLLSTETYLVDTRLFGAAEKIAGLQLPGLTITQGEQGQWLFNGHALDDADAANRFMDTWQHARALFVASPDANADNSAENTAAASEETVRVSFGDQSQRELGLQRPKTGLTLVDPRTGLRYLFTGDDAKQLLQAPQTADTPAAPQ